MHDAPFAVYVPDLTAGPTTITFRSGIVGAPMPDPHGSGESRVLLYYEPPGPALNVVTFADRVMIAAHRMRDRAATHKILAADPDSVIRVATYYPSYKRVEIVPADLDIEPGRALHLLTVWTGAESGGALHHELRESRPDFVSPSDLARHLARTRR